MYERETATKKEYDIILQMPLRRVLAQRVKQSTKRTEKVTTKSVWNTHLVVKAVVVQKTRQSNVISVNDLHSIKENLKRKNLKNILLKPIVYPCEIHFLWLQSTRLFHYLKVLLVFLVCEAGDKSYFKASWTEK